MRAPKKGLLCSVMYTKYREVSGLLNFTRAFNGQIVILDEEWMGGNSLEKNNLQGGVMDPYFQRMGNKTESTKSFHVAPHFGQLVIEFNMGTGGRKID